MEKVVIFGVGNNYHKFKKLIEEKYEVVALIDNNWENFPGVYPVEYIYESNYDKIIITPSDYGDMYQQLIRMGIAEDKIEVCVLPSMVNIVKRLRYLENRYNELGLQNIGGRLDYHLTRLEILNYYDYQERYLQLEEPQKQMLNNLREDLLKQLPRFFFQESYGFDEEDFCKEFQKEYINILQDDGMFYWSVNGEKIYLSDNYKNAERIAGGLYREFFVQGPHNYFDLQGGFTIDKIPNDIVVADVGAAEGLFGMLLIHRAKKIYFFENNSDWIKMLKRTYAPYMEKIEIVEGTVGDKKSEICLDDFFAGCDSPILIKMDVEGNEASVLRGMPKLLARSTPIVLLVCTYHRQEDWEHYCKLLRNHHFKISSSDGYFWHMPDPMPPFFRRGVMRAVKGL